MLFIIVLQNGEKKHSCEKSVICDVVLEQRIHDIHYKVFPFLEMMLGKDALARVEVKLFLEETGIDVSNNQE